MIFFKRLKKRTQNNNKARRQVVGDEKENYLLKGIALILLLIFLSIVIPISVIIYNFNPSSQYELLRSQEWDFKSKFKILLIGVDRKSNGSVFVDALTLLVIHPDNNETSLININPDILVYSTKENTPLTLRRVLLESEGEGIGLLINATEDLVASKIDRYFLIDSDFFENTTKYIKNIDLSLLKEVEDKDLRNKVTWPKGRVSIEADTFYDFLRSDSNGRDDQLRRQLDLYKRYTKSIDSVKLLLGLQDYLQILEEDVDTNLSKLELLMIVKYLSTVPPESYNISYTKSEFLNEMGKSGVYNVFTVNYPLLDIEIDIILRDKRVQLEQARIEIQNASGIGGLASSKSRWITNLGAEVVHIGNAPYLEEGIKVYVKDLKKYPYTIIQLKKTFGESIELVEGNYQYRHIGELVIVFGK